MGRRGTERGMAVEVEVRGMEMDEEEGVVKGVKQKGQNKKLREEGERNDGRKGVRNLGKRNSEKGVRRWVKRVERMGKLDRE